MHFRSDFRHQYSVQETDQTAAELVLVSVPVVAGRVDLHGHGVSRRVGSSLHIGQVTNAIPFLFIHIIPVLYTYLHTRILPTNNILKKNLTTNMVLTVHIKIHAVRMVQSPSV